LLFKKSPWVFLSGFGAATAVLLLVFKDTILSFVASIQLATNDMIRLGDWIEMPKYEANGEVIDIALHTVKVQNWDLTITTIPTFKLIEDSFKNYRGIETCGARRIKRAIHLDVTSVRFVDRPQLERFEKIQLLAPYVRDKQVEIELWNKEKSVDVSSPVNGRRMTNVGTFRAYLYEYLKANTRLRQDMALVVRQLPPGPDGLPIEINVFAGETKWAEFEAIQSDIFDHILAVLPEFDLRAFQNPSGTDLRTGLERRV
jgi:miniconductance mechanosensitive channel